MGFVKVDGANYRYLGTCIPPAVKTPGAVTKLAATDVSPGSADIASFEDEDADACNVRCYNDPACSAFVLGAGKCYLKSAASPRQSAPSRTAYILTGPHLNCSDSTPALAQRSVQALPTRTTFELELPGVVSLNLTFLQTLFAADYSRLSRPVYYVRVDVASLDGAEHDVSLYFDASAQHAVNTFDEEVRWETWSSSETTAHMR